MNRYHQLSVWITFLEMILRVKLKTLLLWDTLDFVLVNNNNNHNNMCKV